MGMLRDARELLSGYLERAAQRVRPVGSGGTLPWANATATGAGYGSGWVEPRHEQVRHFTYWVYVAVSRICDAVAMQIPTVSQAVAQPEPKGFGNEDRGWLARAATRGLVPIEQHEDLTPVSSAHPLCRLLRGANQEDTGFDLMYETVMYLSLTGLAYWWMPKNAAGRPAELWVLPTHWTWPIPGANGLIDRYSLRPSYGGGPGAEIPADEVVRFRRKSPLSKWDGWSPLKAGSRWVDAAESMDKVRYAVFRNGPMPQLAVKFDPKLFNPDSDQLDRLEARIAARYGGEQNAGKPMMVPGGADVVPLWLTPKELDFRTGFEQLRDSILALYGVPLTIVGLNKNMTYGSILAAQVNFCQFTVNPLLAYLGQVITEQVAPLYDSRLRVWWPDQTPQDPAAVDRALMTDGQLGAVTPNEVRRVRGRPPSSEPQADKLIQPRSAVGEKGKGKTGAAGETAGGGEGGRPMSGQEQQGKTFDRLFGFSRNGTHGVNGTGGH